MIRSYLILLVLILVNEGTDAQTALPLFQISDMEYRGAFRLPASTFGVSDLNYSEGPISYNPVNHSLFIVGHDHQQAIAEFSIPTLSTGSLGELNMGMNLQSFVSFLDLTGCGNSQNINQIGGLQWIDGKLYVNAYEYYDADGNVTNTTLIIDDAADLAHSAVSGYFDLAGGAGHTSGWISEIPAVWQGLLGGTYIAGQSSGIPIISRCSVGPSAFSFRPEQMDADCQNNQVSTIRLLDFSLTNPLHEDLSNDQDTNNLWTHLSRATFGMIVPNTRTYLTVGYSGGHASGVCYKCTQDDGNECGGYCAPMADDYSQYYWLWDVNDMLAVKNGTMQPYDVYPYDYGILSTPFESYAHEIGGGDFDPASGLLYLTIQRADTAQGIYANPPVIVAYQITQPECLFCCTQEVQLSTGDVYSGMRVYSQDYIQSDALINGLFNLKWTASDFIEFQPMFEISVGSDLAIEIQECPGE